MGCAICGMLSIGIFCVALIVGAIILFAKAKDAEGVNDFLAHVYRGIGIACIIIAIIPAAVTIFIVFNSIIYDLVHFEG